MHLIEAQGIFDFGELVVGMTVLELQAIERAMRSCAAAAKKPRRRTRREDNEALNGVLEIFNVLEAAKLTRPERTPGSRTALENK